MEVGVFPQNAVRLHISRAAVHRGDIETQTHKCNSNSTTTTTTSLRMSSRLVLSVLVLMLAVASLTEGLRGAGPRKCCFRFSDNPLPHHRAVGYVRTSQRCSNQAVLLKTVVGREMCARPSDAWVKELLAYLDAKAAPGETSPL